MKTTPLLLRRLCLLLTAVLMSASPASAQLVQTLKDINTGAPAPSTEDDEMELVGNSIFIATDDPLLGSELWRFNVLAAFNGARGVAFDSTGNVYVADTQNHVIRKITPAGSVSTLAGIVGTPGFADGAGLTARFNAPEGLCVVQSGLNAGVIYVADTGNHVVRRISPDGLVTTVAGGVQLGAGVQGYVNNINGSDARFRSPRGITARADGSVLFVADSGNHAIRRIDTVSTAVTTLAGADPAGGLGTSGTADGTGSGARFNSPASLTLDNTLVAGDPTMWVADTGNHSIRRVTLGGIVLTVAGSTSGQSGFQNGAGTAARFDSPSGIVSDASSTPSAVVLFIADRNNHQIRRLQASSGQVTTLAGSTTSGSANGVGPAASFNGPAGLAFRGGASPEIVVADAGNHTLRSIGSLTPTAGTVSLRAGQVGVIGSRDGGAQGTATLVPVQLKDIFAGNNSSGPKNLTAFGGNLFFSANDGTQRDLWRSDGTTVGTVRVGSSIFPSDPSGPELLTVAGNNLFFQGYDLNGGAELWRATVSGANTTVERVKDINPTGTDGSLLSSLFNANGTLLFSATDGVNGEELWRSNGTSAGTTMVTPEIFQSIVGSNPGGFTLFNNKYYFAATADDDVGRELHSINSGLTTVTLEGDLVDPGSSEPDQMVVTGGTDPVNGAQLFLVAASDTTLAGAVGRELHVVNSENLTPALVVNLNNASTDSGIQNLTPITVTLGNEPRPHRVIFSADAGAGLGNELYISDGTQLGTVIVEDISPGEASSVLDNFISLSSGLVVFTQEIAGTLHLWRTDGTEAGTFELKDFAAEGSQSGQNLRAPVLLGSNLYFMLSDDELWTTNGQSSSGTFLVHRFRTSTDSSAASDFVRLSDGRVVFSAVDGTGREPWITDLESSTEQLSDIAMMGDSSPADFTPTLDGRVFFSADGPSGRRLYLSDGGSTTPFTEVTFPEELFWHNGRLYLSGIDTGSNRDLWVVDAPTGGAATIAPLEVNPTRESNPTGFTPYGAHVYFAAETGNGTELWRTTGAAGGSTLVKDISFGTPSSNPAEFVVMPASGPLSKLYFIARGSGSGPTADQATGRELWVTDGTSAGTKVVRDIISGVVDSIDDGQPAWLTVVGNELYFVADDNTNGRELWRSNGTSAGTVMVTNLNKVETSPGKTEGSNPSQLRNVAGKLFFLANDGVNGTELYMIASSGGAPKMVSPTGRTGMVNGAADAAIQELTVVGDVLCFTADDGVTGREVWITDGTAPGTQVLTEFVPGNGSSNPHDLAAAGSRLIFAASDSEFGDEPRVAFLSSKLVVLEQPASTNVPPSGTVNYTPSGSVAFGASSNMILRLRNDGTISINKLAASIGGLHAADFTITKKPGASLIKSAFSDMTIQFRPREGGQRDAVLTITSTDADNPVFRTNLTGLATKNPTVNTQPVSQMVKVGVPVNFTAAATGSPLPLTTQWRRNGGPVAGATAGTLYLWAARLADAGAYTALFTTNARPAGTAISDPAQLGVAEDFSPARILPVKLGATGVKLTVNAAGNGLSYLWKRSPNADLSAAVTLSNYTGATTRTLTLPAAQLADSGYYFCEVSNVVSGFPGGGTVVGGTTHVKVFNAPPEITLNPSLPVGIVGSAYFYQVTANTAAEKAPVTFTAKDLPAGLRIDGKTGIISGLPTKVEEKTVTLGVSNGFNPVSTMTATLRVVSLPTGLDGVFQGLVNRDEDISLSEGGRIEVTVTKTGSYSGKLISGAATYSFKGNLMFGLDTMQNPPVAAPPFQAAVRIPRPGVLPPLDLTFTIDDVTKDRFAAGNIASTPSLGNIANVSVSGWKVTTTPSRYVGLHNFGIRLVPAGGLEANDDVPQGNGYGSFTVSAKGALSIAGMTADGEKITCATHVGPNGEVLLYQSLYGTARKGAIAGQLSIGLGLNTESPTDNTITSTGLSWTRPPATAVLGTASNTRTYRAGFGLSGTPVTTPVGLEAFGGYYGPPAPGVILQITNPSSTTDNATLLFTDGGIDGRANVTQIAINDKSAVRILVAAPAGTKISTANRTTGAFGGSFVLADDDITTTTPAALNNKPDEIKRPVNFFGLIVPENGNHRGVGYFMLPQIPPVATAAKTAQILSGKVSFDND